MEILKKVSMIILAIIVFEGPQLNLVDAIEIPKDIKLKVSQEINS